MNFKFCNTNIIKEDILMKYLASKILFTIFSLTLAAAVVSGCSKETGRKIVIKGSTTVLPITQKTAEEYRKINKISITIEGSGSGNGIKALIDGNCDIANSSREMKENEIRAAAEKGKSIKETAIAYDMIVPVIHPSNKIVNITMEQLKAIYDGTIDNWKILGGKDEKIVVISRDTSSGTYEIWHEKVMKKADVRKDALLQASNGAIISAVAGNPKAIGYVGYGYIDSSVKAITINGIEGTIDNGKSGKYPVSRKLFMYTDEKKLSAETQKFIEYILSTDGQKLVKEAGFIPVK